MEVRWSILLMIIGASIVTIIPRVLPLVLLSRLQLPVWVMRWLSHVPIAVMAALVGQSLLTHDGKLSIPHNGIELLAAIPTFAVALFTRSLLGTVVVGIITVMLLRFVA